MSKTWINEVEDQYKGHRYVVKLQSMGHRCGYIEVLPDDKVDDVYDLDVHGGVTFYEHYDADTSYLPKGSWVGFDCAHLNDKPDTVATFNAFGSTPSDYSFGYGVVRTLDYCIWQCESVIDQLTGDMSDE